MKGTKAGRGNKDRKKITMKEMKERKDKNNCKGRNTAIRNKMQEEGRGRRKETAVKGEKGQRKTD